MTDRTAELLLVQYVTPTGESRCGKLVGDRVHDFQPFASTYDLVRAARRAGQSLAAFADATPAAPDAALAELVAAGRLCPPLTHPEPARCLVTGTGLTHLGSMEPRDAMHQAPDKDETDSAKMFRWGCEGGRPADGAPGLSPEWFYKGDGSILVGSGADLRSPAFAERGGEEFEVAMVYVIDDDGTPLRVGCTLGNEFSDHVTEAKNYLYLAHSKLRPCAIGPALRVGTLPDEVTGTARVIREGRAAWTQPFLTGARRMNHALENLEYHHFKYTAFRRPGDVHIHFLGAAVLSWSDGFQTQAGDVFEVEAEGFGAPLRNRLVVAAPDYAYNAVRAA